MKNTFKRVLALALAGAMALSFVACDNGGGNAENNVGEVADGKLFPEGTVISMTIPSSASWPYNENWIVWDYLEEATGAKLQINAIPGADIITKVNLMMASPENFPDLLFMDYKGDVNGHALDGAFVNLKEHLDEMPTFVARAEAMPQGKDMFLAELGAGDGGLYFAGAIPVGLGNARCWLYRRDIFEKNNLEPPKTEAEMLDVARELKKIYPDSYPLCFRNGLGQMDVMGPMWKEYFTYGLYYDFNNEKWNYGALEKDIMFHIIELFQTMHSEGLVPSDFLTISGKSWEELVSTNRGFMMPEYSSRTSFFNKPARVDNPEFTLAYMDPPKGGTEAGAQMIANYVTNPTGFAVFQTGDDKRIANAIKYVDWLYSDEAAVIGGYGKEGETYTVDADGVKHVILEEGETSSVRYGFGTHGIKLYSDKAAAEADLKKIPEMWEIYENFQRTTVPNQNPLYWLGWSDDEQDTYDEYFVAVDTYTKEMLAKFILKQEPMSKYDEFIKTLEELGVNELISICESAYARATGK